MDSANPTSGFLPVAGTQVSTNAEFDLNGDGSCTFEAYFLDYGVGPPLGTNTWTLYCDGSWTNLDLTITQTTFSPTRAPSVCFDTDNGATDRDNDGCDAYANNPSWCGVFDDDNFSSNDMCCVCGGGSSSAFPTQAPTLTNKPSVSPAPTSSPIEVTTYPQLRNPIANMRGGRRAQVQLDARHNVLRRHFL